MIMKMQEIHAKAKALGIKSFGKKKIDIIRDIQAKEGNTACFKSPGSEACEQMDCCWREDCLAA